MTLKVVPLSETCKPHIGTLADRLKTVVNEFCAEQHNVTFEEIIGTLELMKAELIKELLRDEPI